MAKLSAAHQATMDAKNASQREALAYHRILKAIVTGGSPKWGTLQRVGSVYHEGDSWVWQMTFSPRMRDAVIMETFKSRENGDETVRCFFLEDVRRAYENHSFSSDTVLGKFTSLYHHAAEMERIELNKQAA